MKEESKSPEVDTEIQMDITLEKNSSPPLLPKEYLPALQGCRSVEEFQCLNRWIINGSAWCDLNLRSYTMNWVIK